MSGIVLLEVTPGVTWVEVPDAGLRLLCGCPADVVKHLMRRGLIRPTEVAGVACETGPNAILLSDVMIQHGAFSNLAEFPVLQMFYRQGMLLPGHPNNTGERPILIGSGDQVEAQMQYIYRGNYGLISKEELTAAGVDPATAHDMMRLKLRFAFGRIRHPRELLQGMVLADDAVEIRNGVTIRRLDLNVFEIAYGGEAVTVDLNLPPHTAYECPYPLGSYQFHREYFAVVHSGEGDGWDVRRPSMGSVLVFQGKVYLVDAGPNLSHALMALGIGVNEVEGIFQTHSHDDHFAGLTTLMQADRRIKFFAVPMVRAAVAKKLAALLSIEEQAFEDYFEVADLVLGRWNDLGGMDVKPIFSPHPVETTIFQFRAIASDGYRTYGHYADMVGLETLRGMVTDDPDAPGLSQDAFDRVQANYRAPVDLKKLDVGGGLIHGAATDFTEDRSRKLILAHTAAALTPEQKRIGSGASFGTADVLISSHRDFLGRAAFHFLREYFPGVAGEHMGALLNGPVLTFNPEATLVKAGAVHSSIYLLLTGQVEALSEDLGVRAVLSAGALLGEMSGLQGGASTETIRAISFVQVMEIPNKLYATFVARHNLFGNIVKLLERREFLSRTALLGGVVSTGTLNAIAAVMEERELTQGAVIDGRERSIGLIESGRLVRFLGGRVLEELGPGDFFGEEAAVFDAPGIAALRAEEPSLVHMIPAHLLGAIPNVRWKLFESFERRTQLGANVHQEGRSLLEWHDEYSVDIQSIDAQHKKLFLIANSLLDAVEKGQDGADVATALDFLLSYTLYHFEEEEVLLMRYGYADLDSHAERHRVLMTEVRQMEARLNAGKSLPAAELLEFLHGWIVHHILLEDRKYAPFLNERGVF